MNLPIDESSLQRMLHALAPASADDGDLYLQRFSSESISLEEGRVKHLSASTRQGIGARVVVGEMAGQAYTDDLSEPALLEAAKAARFIAGNGGERTPVAIRPAQVGHALYPAIDPAESLSLPARKELLESIDRLARSLDARVVQVFASVVASCSEIHLITLDGRRMFDRRPLVRLSVSVVVEQNGRRETGSAGGGGRFGFDRMFAEGEAGHFTREAVRLALLNLEAIEAPAGSMPVVLGPGWPGVLLHEAVGHGLEGDFNRKGTSTFAGRIGQQVAARGVTVVDDGTMAARRGSLNFDDEGTPTQRNVLIEDGILVGYMQDRQNARLMGVPPTGNGRRESYAHPVLPRMTNTFMLGGNHTPQEIVDSLDRGIHAINFGGGQVDITSGKFVFTTSEAWLIEGGKRVAPVKGATLIGNGPEAMGRISMIGSDMQLDPGVGSCGKGGQTVPVGVGQPTLRIEELIVGGTQS